MIEITEIIKRTTHGVTQPFLCKSSDGKVYYVKGKNVGNSGLIKEFIGAKLAQALQLPIPSFQILYVDIALIEIYDGEGNELGDGYVFGSEEVPSVTELKYESIKEIPISLKKDILIFDLWIRNEDRTLSEFGGNPNLFWKNKELYIIDHNLIFDNRFSQIDFWNFHVFRENSDFDLIDREIYQNKMKLALETWESILAMIPQEWNNDFNLEKTLQYLTKDANGNIWERLK
ncbi:hypothetical protein QUF50_06190 [Thiotrichales bacterium HSG1]|nr:hypothetical protein [Thiotrichales bacterium HSG1]